MTSAARTVARTVRIGSCRILVADDQPTFWDRVEAGTWEPGTLAEIGRRVGPGTVLLDLGAWVGPVSLLAASRGADVVAVEADPAALDQLRRNLSANPELAARIRVVPLAVAPEPGTVRLGSRRKPGDSMSSVLLAETGIGWTVEAVTPAALAAMIPQDRTLVVKLDVEGGEYGLLPALAPVLARHGTALVVSFHPDILRRSGDPDPLATTRLALAALTGMRSFAIGPEGAVPREADPDALEAQDTWLFEVL